MPPSVVSTEQLIQSARSGDRAALAALLEQCRGKLLNAASSGLDQTVDTAAVAAVLNEAQREFANFTGTTEPQLLAWLQSLARRQPAGRNQAAETLVAPPNVPRSTQEEAPPLPAETLVKPPSPPGTPKSAGLGSTIDVTLAKPADMARPSPAVAPVMSMPPSFAAAKAPARRFGNYDLIDTIAKGGMGIVYKARHLKLNRTVALKMILSGQFADDFEVQRFYLEAESAAKLRHPNIVGIHDVGECEGQHFFSMDYIEGKSLGDLLKDQALKPRRASA